MKTDLRLDYQKARNELKPKLKQYLSIKGINCRKNFNCLSPNHLDKHPSMSFKDRPMSAGGPFVHCFACGITGDIFDVASWLDGIDPKDFRGQVKAIYQTLGISESSFYLSR